MSEPTLVLWSPTLHFFVLGKTGNVISLEKEGFYLGVRIFLLRLFPPAVKWNIWPFTQRVIFECL